MIITILTNPGFHLTIIYRLAHFFARFEYLRVISKILAYMNKILYSVDIDYRADLAGGLKIVHGLGIVIGAEVVSLGKLTVYHRVTIGENGSKRNNHNGIFHRQPLIGDNVIIYSGASLLGPIYIGENTIIGANTIVLKDIGANSIAYNENKINIRERRT